MKIIPVINIILYLLTELLLFAAAFDANVFAEADYLIIEIIIACCMIVLPILLLHLICDILRSETLTAKNIVAAAFLSPFIGALLGGLFYAKHGVTFMYSGNEYGLGAFVMGAMSGFIITVIGIVCIIIIDFLVKLLK